MKSSEELRSELKSINHRGYPAYKSLKGSYLFKNFILNIEHVQGDPFAPPSRLSAHIDHGTNGIPPEFYRKKCCRIALQDYLTRRFYDKTSSFSFQAKGSGKSGLISVSRCGQEILERSSCEINSGGITMRFEVGFPANGRTINAGELEKILFDFLPVCIEESLLYRSMPKREIESVIYLAEDQMFIRNALSENGLVAFIADGAILPRESGTSEKPMKGAVPFKAPESMAVTLDLPHHGRLRGMGIPRGVTLIAGGGYHGKSTLLKAMERGVYNHIALDGREYVITDESAVKIRAEDGRKITNTDISMFINNLPNEKDTVRFSTLDASGSTSQAANIAESIEAGARTLFIDEDTSATNFMVRDELMQKVISGDKEPITPFIERARNLYEDAGISTVLVVGSSGEFFRVADKVIRMEAYSASDITDEVKELIRRYPGKIPETGDFRLPEKNREICLGDARQNRKTYDGKGYVKERLKIKQTGKFAFSVGTKNLDLRYVEQLVDGEQTQTLAVMMRYAAEHFGRSITVSSAANRLWEIIEKEGLSGLCGGDVPPGMAIPRIQEIYACINRY